jgi:hypothetical protein
LSGPDTNRSKKSSIAYSTPPTYKAYVYPSRRAAMNAALARVATQLTSLGATSDLLEEAGAF